ncbi:hypothetical protein EV363DRAFT_1291775 [Boletus edulis]|nr:hypothetical protein EV363DRAFT_1291775 [Boletus edulis]
MHIAAWASWTPVCVWTPVSLMPHMGIQDAHETAWVWVTHDRYATLTHYLQYASPPPTTLTFPHLNAPHARVQTQHNVFAFVFAHEHCLATMGQQQQQRATPFSHDSDTLRQ